MPRIAAAIWLACSLPALARPAQPSAPPALDPDLFLQQAYLKASNTGADDSFGRSLAVSGNTAVVGAPEEDSSATGVGGDESDDGAPGAGAAYVFVYEAGTWTQQAYLKASNTEAGDRFGSFVSISGDTIVVGAPGEDSAATGIGGNQGSNGSPESGAAYVFVRNGTTWTEEAYLKASNTGAADDFGHCVSLSNDTAVIGAPGESSADNGVNGNQNDESKPRAGAVYVFVRSGTTWSQQAYVKASTTHAMDEFGQSVAVSGHLVAVGAPLEDSNSTGINGNQTNNEARDSGAAYVFGRSGASWSQQAYLKAALIYFDGHFGLAVAVSGTTVLVGAPNESPWGFYSGSTYVFVRGDAGWSQQAVLDSPATNFEAHFGAALALSGDFAVIGAPEQPILGTGVNSPHNNTQGHDSGAAFVFTRSGTSWSQDAYLKASNTSLFALFGTAVAATDDSAIVGAIGEQSGATGVNGDQGDVSAPGSGAVYVFDTCSAPSSALRNAGTNPASYAASPIGLGGGTFTATVDNAMASQVTSRLFAFDTPLSLTLGGGQTLLCLDLGGSGELFTGGGLSPSTLVFGGTDTYLVPAAFPGATCGLILWSQAIQFGNPPFVLSNAQDLVIGTF